MNKKTYTVVKSTQYVPEGIQFQYNKENDNWRAEYKEEEYGVTFDSAVTFSNEEMLDFYKAGFAREEVNFDIPVNDNKEMAKHYADDGGIGDPDFMLPNLYPEKGDYDLPPAVEDYIFYLLEVELTHLDEKVNRLVRPMLYRILDLAEKE